MDKVTRQKVSAAMRKSGLRAAKFERSGMIRGWGHWISGVRVWESLDGVMVCQQYGHHRTVSDELAAADLAKIEAALVSAGIPFERRGGHFICGVKP